jgi:CSLREA domain-containing protein
MIKLGRRSIYVFILLAILLAQVNLKPVAASAIVFTVNTTVDGIDANLKDGICQTATPGQCTLRAAILQANALSGAKTIVVPAGTYTLTIPDVKENSAVPDDLDVTSAMTINGAGVGQTIVTSAHKNKVFHITGVAVTLQDLTITGGNTTYGGGIYAQSSAVVTLNRVVLNGNNASSGGGGIRLDTGSSASITNSTFSSNTSGQTGGGIDSTGGTLTVVGTTFVNNTAVTTGGGINGVNATGYVINSTFYSNAATSSKGGAIYNGNGQTLTLINSTLTNNSAGVAGGGISNAYHLTVSNSIVAFNSAPSNPNLDGTAATLKASITTNDPGLALGPLASNGGPTQTVAIGLTSSAVDHGDSVVCGLAIPNGANGVDQRGVIRPQGAACDIGAFEAVIPNPSVFTVSNTSDSGAGSLRQAILNANSTANSPLGPDQILFNIPGTGTQTISLNSALPAVTDPVVINGGSNVILNGSGAGTGVSGLVLSTSNSKINNLTITGFNGTGVTVTSGTGNTISHNSIYGNGGLGIDLGGDGVTFNHQGTVAGPNNYQNYPVLTLATSDGSSTRVKGTLTSTAATTFSIDVYNNQTCDPTSFGDGQSYLGTLSVTTDSSGLASFDQTLTVGAAEPQGISATATGPNGTSEFSYCRPVATPNLNWVQAQTVPVVGGISQQIQQYFTGLFQEKWFKFSVQPGDKVTITLTGLPGSAISLHTDPNLIYNSLINPQNAAALSAQAAGFAFLPSGSLPSGSLPSGSLPSGSLPSGSLPSGSLPTGFLPSGSLPSGSLPSGSLPSGSLPSGSLPSGSLPSGSLPSGSLPSGSLPSGSLPSGSLPSGSLPSGSLPSGSLPSGSLPSGSLDAYASAARQSLMGISMDPYATVQTISRDTYDHSGNPYVRVVGPYNLSTPFTVTVTVYGGVCSTIQPVPSILSVISGSTLTPGTFNTLILTHSGRLPGTSTEVATALASLQTLAAQASVNGVVIDLANPIYQRVAWAYTQADQNPTCPAAQNIVATEIKAVINAYRAANTTGGATTLQYIVLAGGDQVIPFYQVPDTAGLANEKDYVPPVAPLTPSEASLSNGLVKGQDYYGSQVTVTLAGQTIATPNLAVGRLVDTAADITLEVNTYLNNGGVVVPNSALVTGYDFVGDAAAAIKTEMDAGTASTSSALIEAQGLPPTDPTAWTADQLKTQLLSIRHDIAVLSGHFSAGNLLAADYTSTLAASDIANSSADLTNMIIMVLGCHSGYSIPNSDLLAGASPNPDWAKAFLRKGAAGYVAATGYAYGDTVLTEYGERLFVELAQQLRAGSGPISLGQALVAAKQQYLAQTAQMSGIDAKTIAEMTLYGLPMMKVNMPGARISPASETLIVTGTTPVPTSSGATAGLSSTVVALNPPVTVNTKSLVNLATNSPVTTTYLSGTDGVVANPFEPIFPKDVYNVSAAGLVLRGVAMRGGTYSDQNGVIPLTTAPTTETSTANLSYNTDVFYPNQVWQSNFYDAINGGATRLVTVPAQYQSSAPGAINGTLRTFSNLSLQLYYLPGNWTDPSSSATVKAAAISAAPIIQGASASANGSIVTFSVNAQADGSAGVLAVWVLYTGKPGTVYYGQWQPLDLTRSTNDPTFWSGTLTLPTNANSSDLMFMVQAVGGAGLTTLGTDLGAYYQVTNPGITPITTTLTLQSPPTTGVYLQNSAFTLVLTGAGQPLAGKNVTLDIGGQQAQAVTDANGSATITLKPVIAPGSYTVQAFFRGDANDLASVASSAFTLNQDSTTVMVAPTSAVIGINQPTPFVAVVRDSSGHALGGKSVVFVVRDASQTIVLVHSVIANAFGNAPLGAAALAAGAYTVDAYFNGLIPVDANPAHNLTLNDDDYASSYLLGSSLIVDITPPMITASATKTDATPYAAGTWTNQAVTVTFACSDPISGIASCPANQVFNTAGTFNASGTANNNVGLSASANFGPIQIDKTAPTITASATKSDATAYTAGAWTNQSVTVHFTCGDTGSGVASCPTDQTFITDGSFTAAGTATDSAGNSANASFGLITIDKTAPTITAAATTLPNAAGWYNSNVTIHFTCADASSGIPAGACPADQTLSAEGAAVSSIAQTVTDAAGNTSAASNVVTVQIDKTAPTASPTQTPAANGAGWNNSDVTVTWNWADNASGAGIDTANCTTSSTSSGEGTLTLNATCKDLAGNTGSASYTVKVDKTAPIITAAATTAPNGAGWYNGNVTIQFTCTDAGSGIPAGACPAIQTLSTEGASVSSTAQTVADVVGNLSAPSNVVVVKIDKTAPVSTASVAINGGQATVTLAAADGLSGVSSTSYSINGGAQQTYSTPFVISSAGIYAVSYFSTDTAGNVETAKTLNFTVLGILDNFNRANGGVGSNWGGLTSTSFYQIASNQLDVQAGGPIYWRSAFGTSQGAFITLTTIDPNSHEQGLLLKVQTSSVPNAGAIVVVYDAVAKAVRVETLRVNTLSWTQYANQAVTFSNGDRLGARALANGTIQIYKNDLLVATVTLNSADQTFFNSKGGSIGLWNVNASNAFVDDFGGGTVSP